MKHLLLKCLVLFFAAATGFADQNKLIFQPEEPTDLLITAEHDLPKAVPEQSSDRLPLPKQSFVHQRASYRASHFSFKIDVVTDGKRFYTGPAADVYVAVGNNILGIWISSHIALKHSLLRDETVLNIADAWERFDSNLTLAKITPPKIFIAEQLDLPMKLHMAIGMTSAMPSIRLLEATVPDEKHLSLTIEAGERELKVHSTLVVNTETMQVVSCQLNGADLTKEELQNMPHMP